MLILKLNINPQTSETEVEGSSLSIARSFFSISCAGKPLEKVFDRGLCRVELLQLCLRLGELGRGGGGGGGGGREGEREEGREEKVKCHVAHGNTTLNSSSSNPPISAAHCPNECGHRSGSCIW